MKGCARLKKYILKQRLHGDKSPKYVTGIRYLGERAFLGGEPAILCVGLLILYDKKEAL
jgi:hypothetical protein